MSHCLHCVVSGRVQGVFYRAATQEKASQLGLTGWVRNCVDGTVELEACGTAEQVAVLQEWLWKGPRDAKVTNVVCKPVKGEASEQGFNIRY